MGKERERERERQKGKRQKRKEEKERVGIVLVFIIYRPLRFKKREVCCEWLFLFNPEMQNACIEKTLKKNLFFLNYVFRYNAFLLLVFYWKS